MDFLLSLHNGCKKKEGKFMNDLIITCECKKKHKRTKSKCTMIIKYITLVVHFHFIL